MTNETIRILKLAIEDSKEHIRFCFDLRGIEALNMAIKALEQQEQLEAHIKSAYDCGYNCGYADAMNDIAESGATA